MNFLLCIACREKVASSCFCPDCKSFLYCLSCWRHVDSAHFNKQHMSLEHEVCLDLI